MDDERALMEFGQIEGQYNVFDYIDEHIQTPLIAVSKVFARALKQMNLAEWKTFIFALTQIKWTEANKSIIRLDKKDLAEKIGINSDIDHLSDHIKRAIGDIPAHSLLKFESGDNWENGNFIRKIGCYKNVIRLTFEEDYLSLFQELDKEKKYITLWADDLFSMTSERSILFYEDLRLHSDTRTTNSRIYSTKDLKELFNIPKNGKGSYMHFSKQKNQEIFDRANFEKYVLTPLCEDLKKCSMINLCTFEEGGYWEKVKKHGYVVGYRFVWDVSQHPAVATAAEVREIQERVDKDPRTLKVAKDIVNGRKQQKDKKNQKKPRPDAFEERQRSKQDFEELEKQLRKN